MTSPGIEKPESSSGDLYNDVHSRGSSFGQDLTEHGVRQLLKGRDTNPFINAIDGFVGHLTNLGEGLVYAVDMLMGGSSNQDVPPLYAKYADSAFKALKPIHSMADQALEKADTAQGKAEDLTEKLTGSVNGDLAEAVNDHGTLIGKINQKASEFTEAFGGWTEEKQTEFNSAMALGHAAQAKVNDVNELNWITQAEYDANNDALNRVQSDTLKIHENQLVWMDAKHTRTWTFYTARSHERAPWIDLELIHRSVLEKDEVRILGLGSWAGRLVVQIFFSDGASDHHEWTMEPGTKEERYTFFEAGATHLRIKNVLVMIYPWWGNHKREYLLKPVPLDGRPDAGFQHTEAYVNDYEGNPIAWSDADQAIRFKKIKVKANHDIWVWDNTSQMYTTYKVGSSGQTAEVPLNTWVRALSDDLVVFTEA